jgi:uncharacterized protein
MLSPMPDFADPWRLCALGRVYAGSVALAEMPRLRPLLASAGGEAHYVLRCGRDADARSIVAVEVRAALPLQCQRCMGEVLVEVEATASLALVAGPEEAARLAEGLDPLLVEDGRIELRTLVEDELILAIPVAPMHPAEVCAVDLAEVNVAPEQAPEADAEQQASPFAVLAGWRSDNKTRN